MKPLIRNWRSFLWKLFFRGWSGGGGRTGRTGGSGIFLMINCCSKTDLFLDNFREKRVSRCNFDGKKFGAGESIIDLKWVRFLGLQFV